MLRIARRLRLRPLPLRERATRNFNNGSRVRGNRFTPHPTELADVLALPSPSRGEGAITAVALATRLSEILPAVGRNRRAGDQAGVVGGQEHHAARDLVRLAQPADRD